MGKNSGPAAETGGWQDETLLHESAGKLNRALLARFPGGAFRGDLLPGFLIPEGVRPYLVPDTLQPESRALVYPVRDETPDRIQALAEEWPDPRAHGINPDDALRATAPLAILDLLGILPHGRETVTAASSHSAAAITGPVTRVPAAPAPAETAGPVSARENIPESLGDLARKAVEAFIGSDWHVSSRPWGTVSVDLNPRSCRALSALAGMVAVYGGKNFVKSLLSGKPWYMIVIWGLLAADTGYVGMVLSLCAANNRRARLYWNALTGIFYATEIKDADILEAVSDKRPVAGVMHREW